MVKSKFPEVKLISNEKNLGFSKANNRAIKEASGDYIFILNPDTLVQEDTLNTLIDFLESHPDGAAAGCKVLNADGTLQLACRRSTPTPSVVLPKVLGLSRLFPKSKLFGKYNLTYLDEDEISEVDAVSGSCVMVRKSVIDEIGMFDENYFMYGEDLDWFYRMKKAGYKIFYVPDTKIVHYKGESSRAAGFDSIKLFYKAQIQFVRKHFSKSKSTLTVMLLYTGIVLRAFFSLAIRGGVSIAPALSDILLMQSSLLIAIRFKFGSFDELNTYLLVDMIYTSVWLLSSYLLGAYGRRKFSAIHSAWGVILGFFVNTTFTFFFKQFAYSRQVLISLLFLNIVFLPAWRIGIRFARKFGFAPFLGTLGKTFSSRRTALIGSGDEAEQISKKILELVHSGYKIEGFIDKSFPESYSGNTVYLGNLDDIEEIITDRKITDIIFAQESLSIEEVLKIMVRLKQFKVNFKVVPKQMDIIIGKSSIESIEEFSLIDLDYNIDKPFNRIVKRSFDITFSSLLLLILTPLALVLVVFGGKRLIRKEINLTGDRSKIISMLGKKNKIRGSMLFNYPLLFHVLKGTLTFVGSEIMDIGSMNRIVQYKPGLTGFSTIMNRNKKEIGDIEKYDYYYMRNQTLRLDIEIIVKEIFKI